MKLTSNYLMRAFVVLIFVISSQANAEIHPVLFKDEPDLYPKIYFGMGYEEFKSKLGSNIFECKDLPNKNVAEKACKLSFRFNGSGLSESMALFKNGTLVASIGRINSDYYGATTSALSVTYKTQPQVESKEEKKGFFSKKISNEYSIWMFSDYLMLVSKFDIPKFEENGTNFLLAVESTDSIFIDRMRAESKSRSNIVFQMMIANVDLSKLHLPKEIVTEKTNVQTSIVSGAATSSGVADSKIGESAKSDSNPLLENKSSQVITNTNAASKAYEKREIRPLILKSFPDLYKSVYFNMTFADFENLAKGKGLNLDCTTEAKTQNKLCKMNVMGSVIRTEFKPEKLETVDFLIDSKNFDQYKNQLTESFKDEPKLFSRKEGGFNIDKFTNEYFIWNYRNPYLLEMQRTYTNAKFSDKSKSQLVETVSQSLINLTMKGREPDTSKIDLASGIEETPTNPIHTVATNLEPQKAATTPAISVSKEELSRSLLTSDMNYGAKSELLKTRISSCFTSDKFLSEFRKSFPKFAIDEYCVGKNLVSNFNVDTVFLLKDGTVKSIIHRAETSEFRKVVKVYSTTFGSVPKNKQLYKASKPVECYSESNLQDFVDFCKQQDGKFQLFLASDSSTDMSNSTLNRVKLFSVLNSNEVFSTSNPTATTTVAVKNGSHDEKQVGGVDATPSNQVWKDEPTSFLGIQINQPLINSGVTLCPMEQNKRYVDYDAVRRITSLCYAPGDNEIDIWGLKIDTLFSNAAASTDSGTVDGNVQYIRVKFDTDNASKVIEMLTIKYGKPHSNEIGKVKTNGGAEFEKNVLFWSGKKVNILVNTLFDRGFSSGRIYEHGYISFSTKDYIDKQAQKREGDLRKAAEGL